ncbi:hypothetical protein CMI47_03540 [Candidatus Pacearchaeota archaeon]|nr:hypothetical protein [Candidatus Pacearchaeota archaeon]
MIETQAWPVEKKRCIIGYLDHSTNNIILDAVLTDIGRQFLARNDGSFSIVKFALGDDEIDYSIIKKFGRTVGKEKIEKNTPVLEALTRGNLGQKYRLVSISNPNLTKLPSLSLTGVSDSTLSLTRSTTAGDISKKVTIEQSVSGGGVLAPELTDASFKVTIDNLFLSIPGLGGPDSINADNIATYIIPADPITNTSNLGALTMTIQAKSVSNSVHTTYKQKGGSVVQKVVEISGMNSGAFTSFKVQIS